MTTKEIACAVGKDITTVQRWIKKMNGKMQSIDSKMRSSSSTNPADFDLSETIAIIETGMGKNAADIYRMNASAKPDTNSQESQFITKADLAEFGRAIVGEMMKQVIPMIQATAQTKPATIAIEAPEISLRDQLRKIVDSAARVSGDYAGTYNQLYTEIRYRLHINVAERARNAGVSKIDILDAEGQLMNAILIAREIFK